MIAESKTKADFSVIVTTYQRPHNLRCVLDSLAHQARRSVGFEIVVSDDGSTDETPQVVEEFRQRFGGTVHFVTHPHDGFQAAKCRNQGAAAATSPYLIFLDGDCIAGERFVEVFARQAKREEVLAGDVYCLTESQTREYFSCPQIEKLAELDPVEDERKRVRRRHEKFKRAEFWQRFRKPRNLVKPALKSGVFGIWRDDYYRVNGFDQNYVGWGCEDDDLGMRLRMAGIQIRSIIPQLDVFHLWHPRGETVPDKWKEGANAAYFQRRGRLARCVNGAQQRLPSDLDIRVQASPDTTTALPAWLKNRPTLDGTPEVELVVWPGQGTFQHSVDCRVLIAEGDTAVPRRLLRQADRIVTDQAIQPDPGQQVFALADLQSALESIT